MAESPRPTFQKQEEQEGPTKEKERWDGGAKNSGDETKHSSLTVILDTNPKIKTLGQPNMVWDKGTCLK